MNVLISLRENKKLTDTEMHIRDYVLQNKEAVVHMSVHELADYTFTSPATVVRLCYKIEPIC